MKYRLILECDVEETGLRWPDDSTTPEEAVVDSHAYVREHGKIVGAAAEVRDGMWIPLPLDPP